MRLLNFSPLLLLINAAQSFDSQIPIIDESSSDSLSLLELHKSLVEIGSITGNEHDVGALLISYLKEQNLTVEIQEVELVESSSSSGKKRQNVLAYIGNKRQTRTLVTSHIDTVPPFWPYERRGDEIWGRGSVDAKASVAAQITAYQDLIAAGKIHEGDVALLYVVGEETLGAGMKKANNLGLSWETVIFGEPTELKLAAGHKGIMSLRITAKGKAGHSGYPSLGRNANAMLIPALYELGRMDLPWSEKYGNTTLNIGRVDGGVAANVIAEDAMAKIAIRIAAGTPEELRKSVLDVIEKTGQDLDVEFTQGYGPVHCDSDVEGFETITVNYGTDVPNLEGDHKRYLYGPGDILVAHSDHEHLKISDLEEAVSGYKKLIEHSLA
ncbi:putative acetylornithine deacetylase protein [Botrytis fragariae]|uniref:Putative acetylornithine deacetylase protein n=1 Tax=Botrytis fragariae TaxID=1964551 RepID=A0A8H6B3T0_9HELO|nr:putative acetylornithine deacetylase protein [Botrytis fragariae]KAF5878623.1 putative acetylornithine deacetylase protein [Botrytis fragariae]